MIWKGGEYTRGLIDTTPRRSDGSGGVTMEECVADGQGLLEFELFARYLVQNEEQST